MIDDEKIFIYDPFTHQKLLIDEETLVADYRLYHDWKVYQSFTGNPKVSDWIKAKEDAAKDMDSEPAIPRIISYVKEKE